MPLPFARARGGHHSREDIAMTIGELKDALNSSPLPDDAEALIHDQLSGHHHAIQDVGAIRVWGTRYFIIESGYDLGA